MECQFVIRNAVNSVVLFIFRTWGERNLVVYIYVWFHHYQVSADLCSELMLQDSLCHFCTQMENMITNNFASWPHMIIYSSFISISCSVLFYNLSCATKVCIEISKRLRHDLQLNGSALGTCNLLFSYSILQITLYSFLHRHSHRERISVNLLLHKSLGWFSTDTCQPLHQQNTAFKRASTALYLQNVYNDTASVLLTPFTAASSWI